MSFSSTVSQYHADLARIMRPFQSRELTMAEIKELVEADSGHGEAQWVQPSDHCKNHRREGACECALSDSAIFERIEWNRYRVR